MARHSHKLLSVTLAATLVFNTPVHAFVPVVPFLLSCEMEFVGIGSIGEAAVTTANVLRVVLICR